MSVTERPVRVISGGTAEEIIPIIDDRVVEGLVCLAMVSLDWTSRNCFSKLLCADICALATLMESLRSEFWASSQKRDKKAAMTTTSVAITIILKVPIPHFKILPIVEDSNSPWGSRLIFAFATATSVASGQLSQYNTCNSVKEATTF